MFFFCHNHIIWCRVFQLLDKSRVCSTLWLNVLFPPCRSDSAADKIRWVYFLIVPVEVVACIVCWWAYPPWPALLSPHLPWPHPPLMWHRFTPLSTNQGVWIRFTFGEASSEYSCKPWNAIVIFYWTNNIRHKQGFVGWALLWRL